MKAPSNALHFFNWTLKTGFTHREHSYFLMLEIFGRARNLNSARNFLLSIPAKSNNAIPLTEKLFSSLSRSYGNARLFRESIEVFELYDEMLKTYGAKPNLYTFNILIRGFCMNSRMDDAFRLLERGGFVPDTCTFNMVMNAHCNVGDLSKAFKVFEKMKELKVQQDSASYSVLIRGLCQKLDFGMAEELIDKFLVKEILLCDDGSTPIVAAYNPILEYLCRNGKMKKAEQFLRQLMRRGKQNPVAYKTLILGHCKKGTCVAGHKLLVLMLRRDFLPDLETYESLIEALLQKGEPYLAHDTLEMMLKSSYLPGSSTFQRILTELVKQGSALESASLVILMLKK
ncbi:pentatricopeptide repeat-containing At1g02060, chloroplastic [Olea europaea subsp. europaea]|uniref:Pentatricopeptide repeat-containing At1g02060, chloroplastic n=1 Tax=Olea europaea subsp. europaea TaxID=158383 RepID=A0A8S0QXW9_OLEEU|nr:pentatricopeptide repeat-containing At1g02060, chloroplastic [Olea europaea subsp. europaea]